MGRTLAISNLRIMRRYPDGPAGRSKFPDDGNVVSRGNVPCKCFVEPFDSIVWCTNYKHNFYFNCHLIRDIFVQIWFTHIELNSFDCQHAWSFFYINIWQCQLCTHISLIYYLQLPKQTMSIPILIMYWYLDLK